MSKLPTGIAELDRQLEGGFAAGNLVALVSPPDAPSARVLHQLMRQRPTTYISTLRPRSDIETELERLGTGTGDVDIAEVGEVKQREKMLHSLSDSDMYSANTTDRERILDEVHEVIDAIGDGRNVIVDPTNALEASESEDAYQRFLRSTAAKLREVQGLGVLHSISYGDPPPLRERTLTMADTVWNLEMGTDNQEDLALKMTIPKNRGGELIFEQITLLVEKGSVHTDKSRAY